MSNSLDFTEFKESNIVYLQEKYISILKELKYIQGVSNYYHSITTKGYANFYEIYEDLEIFKEYIEEIYKHNKYGVIKLKKIETLYEFFIILDIQNYKIEEILKFFSVDVIFQIQQIQAFQKPKPILCL